MSDFFIACLTEKLGPVKSKEVTDRYNALVAENERGGFSPDARLRAMNQVTAERAKAVADKARITQGDLAKAAMRKQRIEDFDYNRAVFGKTNNRENPGAAVRSLLERDARGSGINYFDTHEATFNAMWAMADEVAEKMGKGLMGRQKGKAFEENLVREILGEHTGDEISHEMARGYHKADEAGIGMFTAAGGVMNKLDKYLPQSRSLTKVLAGGEEAFIRAHSDGGPLTLDWDRMRRPDGSRIPPDQREAALRASYRAIVTDGRVKMDDSAGRGQGSSKGNKTDEHRFLIYKDADAWLAAHAMYGEGGIQDVISHHFDKMAHDTAMVSVFGSNPEMGYEQAKLQALKHADARIADPADTQTNGAAGAKYLADTQATMVLTDKMYKQMARQNPSNPESRVASGVSGAMNVLTSAMLGSVPLLGIADDMTKMGMMKGFNGMDIRPMQTAKSILDAWLLDKAHSEKMMAQSGFIAREQVMSNYAATRYGSVAQYAPAWSRRLSDATMRLSGMAGWTNAAKSATEKEFMGALARSSDQEFHELPYAAMMQRYGISPEDWDKMRAIPHFDAVAGRSHADFATDPDLKAAGMEPSQVAWLRPIDAMQAHPGEEGFGLYQKFQNMILAETRYAIPENTVEAQVQLRDTTKPDSLAGIMLNSFAAFKNFPITMLNQYGRLAMSNPDRLGRLSFIAGLGVTMTMVGALGIQLRELVKGRDPLPMNTPAFLGKAFLAGGSLSVYGDFLFANVNEYGHTMGEQAGGPLLAMGTDAANLLLSDPYKWIDEMSKGKALHDATAPAAAVNFAKHYAPGSSLWWARLALEREVFDRLAEMADPKAYRKFATQVSKQRKDYGNDYWSAPGTGLAGARWPNLRSAMP